MHSWRMDGGLGRPLLPPPAGTVSAGQSPGRRHLEGSVRVWVREEAGQVVWVQKQDRVCISHQGTESVPKGSLESWRPVSYGRIKFIFRKKILGSILGLGLREISSLREQGLGESRSRVGMRVETLPRP